MRRMLQSAVLFTAAILLVLAGSFSLHVMTMNAQENTGTAHRTAGPDASASQTAGVRR